MSYSGIQLDKDGSVTVFVKLSDEIYGDLRKSAEEAGISVIDMVRQAIENEIYEPEGEDKPKT